MNENDPRNDEAPKGTEDEQAVADIAAETETYEEQAEPRDDAAIVNDNSDEPQFPDEQTIAETTAAQAAVWNPTSLKKNRGPSGIVILLAVLAGIIGLGVYTVWWSNRLFEKNEMIELRVLEERQVMADWQKKNMSIKFPNGGVAPAGVVYKPLQPEEKARYDALMAKYKGKKAPFEPNENEMILINETKKLMGTK